MGRSSCADVVAVLNLEHVKTMKTHPPSRAPDGLVLLVIVIVVLIWLVMGW